MSWNYWNRKQKDVFVILVIILIIIFICLIPFLKGKKPIPGLTRIIAILLPLGLVGIVELFKKDYEEDSYFKRLINWNSKQKRIFYYCLFGYTILFFVILSLNIHALVKTVGLLSGLLLFRIIKLYKNEFEERITNGNCIKCNEPCEYKYYEKDDQIEYNCPTCGKYKY